MKNEDAAKSLVDKIKTKVAQVRNKYLLDIENIAIDLIRGRILLHMIIIFYSIELLP